MNHLAVVIPSKSWHNLTFCVGSLRQCGFSGPVIVVDDGIKPRRRMDDNTYFIEGRKPFNFSRNVNLGIAEAEDRDVILMNDDAKLCTPCGFAFLHFEVDRHPECGIVSPVVNMVGNASQFPNYGRGQAFWYEPQMLCFVCAYIPRRTIDAVGLLDERFGPPEGFEGQYVGYGCEDDDYCLRVRRAGLKLGVYNGCFIDHAALHSTYRMAPEAPAPEEGAEAHRRIFRDKWGFAPRSRECEESKC